MTFSKKVSLSLCLAGLLAGISSHAMAQSSHHDHHGHHHGHDHHAPASLSIGSHSQHNHGVDAPISIMGDHMHAPGEWMISYRFSRMHMEGNQIGTNNVTPEYIVSNIANSNEGPANLRVVPLEMTMNMHMLGTMVGITDWLTLMAMGHYMDNEMSHITFSGMSGTTRRGEFITESSGFGDTSISSLVRLYKDDKHHLHLNLGLSLPTGSITETDDVLAPNGSSPILRLPYAMQLGSGTYDALPGITYTGHQGDWGWGAQYRATIRLEDENDEGYSLGDRHALTGWASYQATDAFSLSGLASFTTLSDIDGRDSQITAPVQTADPDNYGGEVVELGLGVSFSPQGQAAENHTLTFDVRVPVYQDLNGPQMENDWTLTTGWKMSF